MAVQSPTAQLVVQGILQIGDKSKLGDDDLYDLAPVIGDKNGIAQAIIKAAGISPPSASKAFRISRLDFAYRLSCVLGLGFRP